MEVRTLLLIALVSLHFDLSNSISFDLAPDVKKCLAEEIHKDVLVVGEFSLSEAQGQKTDLKVGQQLISSHHYLYKTKLLSTCFCRFQIPRVIFCTARMMPPRESLRSLLMTMKCLKCASTQL